MTPPVMLDLGDGMIFAPTDVIAGNYRIPASTIRRWASEDHWQRRRIRGTTYYLMSAVEATYQSRRNTRRGA